MFRQKRKPSDFAAKIRAHLEIETEQLVSAKGVFQAESLGRNADDLRVSLIRSEPLPDASLPKRACIDTKQRSEGNSPAAKRSRGPKPPPCFVGLKFEGRVKIRFSTDSPIHDWNNHFSLPHPGQTRRGRDGCGLQGRGHQTWPLRGPQVPSRGPSAGRPVSGTLSP